MLPAVEPFAPILRQSSDIERRLPTGRDASGNANVPAT